MRNKISPFDLVRKIIESQKYTSKDIDLKRYTPTELTDYIFHCCEEKYYIEAYTLAIQYINSFILSFIATNDKIKDQQVSTILFSLFSIGLIDKKSYSNYVRINSIRNDVVHALVRNKKVPQALKSKSSKAHKEDLDKFILNFESIFLNLVKQYSITYFSNLTTNRSELFKRLVIKKAFSNVLKSGYKVSDKEIFTEKFDEEVKKILATIKFPSKIKFV
jgi:uncharacterized protein YutE (UPF0331/DUF86 family)